MLKGNKLFYNSMAVGISIPNQAAQLYFRLLNPSREKKNQEPMNHPSAPLRQPILSTLGNAVLRAFFHLLYHSMAWSYDLVAAIVSVGRWKSWSLAAASLVSGSRVLELGHGPGHLQVYLNAAGVDVFGIDESRQMSRQAARRLYKNGYPIRLARGVAQSLPYLAESFDSVLATFPTNYIFDPRTLAEIQRVLRPGGKLVVLMAAWITGNSPIEQLMAFVTRVTRQTPPPDEDLSRCIEPFTEAGFQASLKFEEVRGSRLMLILAYKDHSLLK